MTVNKSKSVFLSWWCEEQGNSVSGYWNASLGHRTGCREYWGLPVRTVLRSDIVCPGYTLSQWVPQGYDEELQTSTLVPFAPSLTDYPSFRVFVDSSQLQTHLGGDHLPLSNLVAPCSLHMAVDFSLESTLKFSVCCSLQGLFSGKYNLRYLINFI